MTGTDLCVNKPHLSRSYLNNLVYRNIWAQEGLGNRGVEKTA
jgi:hypothetical protein